LGYVFLDGLGSGEVKADGPPPAAFFGDADGGAVLVLVKTLDTEPVHSSQPGS
jgi:hypothetical protein